MIYKKWISFECNLSCYMIMATKQTSNYLGYGGGDCVRHAEGGRSPVRSTEANSVARSTPTRAKRGTRPKTKK